MSDKEARRLRVQSVPYTDSRHVSDFAQEGAAANRGPEARGPKVSPSKTKKSADFAHYFFI